MKNKKEQGITLVSLITTTIILILLASITIYNIMNYNILKQAVVSIEKYDKEKTKETQMMNDITEIVGNTRENQKPVEKTYITDSLMVRYDGIQNTREGHKNDTIVWEDLSGNNRDMLMQNKGLSNDIYWGNDGITQTSASTMYLKTELISELANLTEETIECVFKANADGGGAGRDIFGLIGSNTVPYCGALFELEANRVVWMGHRDTISAPRLQLHYY